MERKDIVPGMVAGNQEPDKREVARFKQMGRINTEDGMGARLTTSGTPGYAPDEVRRDKTVLLSAFGELDRMRNLPGPQKSLYEPGTGFWDSYAGDVLERVGAGAADISGGLYSLVDRGYKPLADLIAGKDTGKSWFRDRADETAAYANTLRGRSVRNGGKSAGELFKEGDFWGALGNLNLDAAEMAVPLAATALGGAGAAAKAGQAANTVLAFANGARKADELDKIEGMSGLEKGLNVASGVVFDAAGGKALTGGLKKGMGEAYGRYGKDIVGEKIVKAVANRLDNNPVMKKALESAAEEGLEGYVGRTLENTMDYMTGATDEWKPTERALNDALASGLAGGAVGGVGAAVRRGQRGEVVATLPKPQSGADSRPVNNGEGLPARMIDNISLGDAEEMARRARRNTRNVEVPEKPAGSDLAYVRDADGKYAYILDEGQGLRVLQYLDGSKKAVPAAGLENATAGEIPGSHPVSSGGSPEGEAQPARNSAPEGKKPQSSEYPVTSERDVQPVKQFALEEALRPLELPASEEAPALAPRPANGKRLSRPTRPKSLDYIRKLFRGD